MSPTDTAFAALTKWLEGANEIYGLDAFATVAAAVALGALLRGKGAISFIGNTAAAGVWGRAPSRVPFAPAMVGNFWRTADQPSALCWIEVAPVLAAPAAVASLGQKSSFSAPTGAV